MQLALFDNLEHRHIVNVASVPQRSPFRYPGGKTWIVPRIRLWLSPLVRRAFGLTPIRPSLLLEPFVGGGSVSLAAATEHLVDHTIMVELDQDVAAVWQTILDEKQWQWLAHKIETFDLTTENVKTYFARTNLSLQERAFKTILRNRVNRGGIIAPGAGLLKAGENGKGLKSRWYPLTLKKRIQHIAEIRERITFIQGDGIAFLRQYARRPDTIFFIDPPYTFAGKKAGSRLYTHSEIDHEKLFEVVNTLQGDFLMTYDNVEDIRQIARQYNFDMQAIPMKNTHHTEMTELLISRNLEWLRQPIRLPNLS
ncbi:MAG TPA: DNA adenine methylase [Ktedonosporobacter sp.]|jgi:DNA adenine methylase|nr:DNA adenine methylase [Ktedonosporobacter sp.]